MRGECGYPGKLGGKIARNQEGSKPSTLGARG
jgi:hypothetical protein